MKVVKLRKQVWIRRTLWTILGASLCVGAYTGFLFNPRYSILLNAIGDSNPNTVRLILDSGLDPNYIPNDPWTRFCEGGFSPIAIAAGTGNVEIVKILLDHNADVDLGDGWTGSPLAEAALTDHLQVMQVLIDHGATINEDESGSYALWRAAMEGKTQAVSLLLAHGANPNSTLDDSTKEVTLLKALMERSPNAPVIKLLKAAGAKEWERDSKFKK